MPDSDSEEEPTIASDVVVTKYKMVGDMVNGKLDELSITLLKWLMRKTKHLSVEKLYQMDHSRIVHVQIAMQCSVVTVV